MRKASHITLMKLLIDEVPELRKHKVSLLIGCILPDCLPSIAYRRHTINETIHLLGRGVCKLNKSRNLDVKFCLQLGIVTHYIADYFTLHHNKEYNRGIKYHTIYEGKLRKELKRYILNIKNQQAINIGTTVDIIKYIKEIHAVYLINLKNNAEDIKNDCYYITKSNIDVVRYIVKNKVGIVNC